MLLLFRLQPLRSAPLYHEIRMNYIHKQSVTKHYFLVIQVYEEFALHYFLFKSKN